MYPKLFATGDISEVSGSPLSLRLTAAAAALGTLKDPLGDAVAVSLE